MAASRPESTGAHPARMEARMVRLEALCPNPSQPRSAIPEASVTALAESIRQTGLLQPITVRRKAEAPKADIRSRGDQSPAPEGRGALSGRDGAEFEVVAGERRWRAARLAGLREVPVIVRDVSDEEMLELALVENIQREDLNPIDRARAYRQYCERFRRGLEHVARRLGEDRSTVSNFLRLLDLPPDVQELVAEGRLSAGHARAILALEHPKRQSEMARQAVESGFSVREIEQVVRAVKDRDLGAGERLDAKALRKSGAGSVKSPHLRDMESKLERACGTKVSIQEYRRKGQGKIVIEFYSLDDFDRIARKLGVRPE